jgi:hypothetical protein
MSDLELREQILRLLQLYRRHYSRRVALDMALKAWLELPQEKRAVRYEEASEEIGHFERMTAELLENEAANLERALKSESDFLPALREFIMRAR